MRDDLSDNVWRVLSCSYCGAALEKTSAAALCSACESTYPRLPSGALDMRLAKPRKLALDFEIGAELPSHRIQFEALRVNARPEVDLSGVDVPWHLTAELLSYFPKARTPNSLMLDLGCGTAIHRAVCERAGFEWVGLDYDSEHAPIIGDAQALPFADQSFDFILSIAVLEHIRFPFAMMHEAYRVLKPGGKFIGTVAFLEPYHAGSFYHHSHLGIFNTLHHANFNVEIIAPSARWSVLFAQASMALFPRMPAPLAKGIMLPAHLLHRLWWLAGGLMDPNANETTRVRNTTGSFTFVATR